MKKLRLIVGVAIALLSCTASIAADDPPDLTMGAFNGRYWQRLPLAVKVGFVTGFDSAMNVALVVTQQNREMFRVKGTNGDLVKALDEYYQRQDDFRTPIWVAIRVIKLEKDGLSRSEIGER